MNELISNGDDCRTAPVTPGVLKSLNKTRYSVGSSHPVPQSTGIETMVVSYFVMAWP